MNIAYPRLATFAICLCLLSGLNAQDSAVMKAPESVKDKDSFHIFLLIGGSNMTGKVTFPKADKKTDSRIFVLNSDNAWKSADEIQKFQDKTSDLDNAGPGISFGKAMLQNARNDEIIGIINCASPNSEIKSWAKGSELYNKAVEKVKLAQKCGILKGILWHQGEMDAKGADLKAYGENTAKLINDLREDLAPEQKISPLPFVGGKLFSYPFDKEVDIFKDFNDNLDKTYEEIDRHGLVETKGLKVKGDNALFDNDSMIELGRRYAESMSYLYGKRKEEKKKK